VLKERERERERERRRLTVRFNGGKPKSMGDTNGLTLLTFILLFINVLNYLMQYIYIY
jgi:hypothetical protein